MREYVHGWQQMDSSLAVPEYANGTKIGIQQLKEMFEQAEKQDSIKSEQFD